MSVFEKQKGTSFCTNPLEWFKQKGCQIKLIRILSTAFYTVEAPHWLTMSLPLATNLLGNWFFINHFPDIILDVHQSAQKPLPSLLFEFNRDLSWFCRSNNCFSQMPNVTHCQFLSAKDTDTHSML